ncbi:MAG: LLM class flavin-dependent oxidoreductase [Actinobacteria bacterium]|nr:LLM class flavin-dependent oxidoreductase [Actinomycetota bacterium]MBV8958054.1 LLM class flavin-dependent oxidoreductase [Actinomycetota bacterium]MBV9253541.1 LLM class flavin-dependent oxidoreductase [Actinomycetota bacterium]MBV9663907.1 LLM class flavin-dependent oxidoreductase [Actinomycetota bacterium]MBV9936099.1 LLM class flavin-dependent oxidoreductase [Actinomycetota bacterium]
MAMPTIRFDLRLPDFATTTRDAQYAAALEQAAWAEQHGFATAVLSEHHGTDDGFIPSPLVMAGAIAAKTSRIHITISALLVPLHDPLRLAEDIAVVDHISRGRLAIVAGLGYRPEEFEMFGVDRTKRGRILEEHVEVMRKAWTGEPFEYRGTTVQVSPTPYSQPHPLLFIGGSTEIAARRAARLQLPMFPAIGDPALADIYNEECAKVGYQGWVMLPQGPGFVHVTEDPEKAWAQIGRHALFDAETYSAWQTPGQRSNVHVAAQTVDDVKASGVYRIVTPDECVKLIDDLGPMGALCFHPLMGGMDPDLGWESLELYATKVLPRIA